MHFAVIKHQAVITVLVYAFPDIADPVAPLPDLSDGHFRQDRFCNVRTDKHIGLNIRKHFNISPQGAFHDLKIRFGTVHPGKLFHFGKRDLQ